MTPATPSRRRRWPASAATKSSFWHAETPRLVAVLRSLTDEDFKRAVPFGPARGRPLSIEDLGRSHLDRHLASMRATLRR